MRETESDEKMQKVIRFLKKRGSEGATYRELDLHLAGPESHMRWLERKCRVHPDIRAEGTTRDRRVYYGKGRGMEGYPNQKVPHSYTFTTEIREAIKDRAWEMRITQSEFVTRAIKAYLVKTKKK